MQILYLLIPLGMVLVGVGAASLVWAVVNGQYDQLDVVAQQLPDDER